MAGDAEKVPLDKMANRVVARGRDSLSARHSDRDAGREHRRGGRSVDHLPARAAGVRATGSLASPRKWKAPRRKTARYYVLLPSK